MPRVLIIVENLPVLRDRRVWRECRALVAAGYGVSVICPRGPGDRPRQEVEGVIIHSYPHPPTARGVVGFVIEYLYSWVAAALLTIRVLRRDGADVLQVCNPPDIYFPLGLAFRALGKPFVFDHHDLSPEVYMSRFGRGDGWLLWLLRRLERATFRSATHVISTNQSYRAVALGRGGKRPDEVTVVRNGPDLDQMYRTEPDNDLRCGREHLVLWFGVMGPQDGVDQALLAAQEIVHGEGRRDVHFAFVGKGDALEDMRAMARRLDLESWTTFTGYVSDHDAFTYLSTADVGLSPDPMGPLNDVSTMNKTMEYMAYGLPVVAFDLRETRVSAQEAALYAPAGDVDTFAAHILRLLDDPDLRRSLGARGRARVEQSLAWAHQRDAYVDVFARLTESPARTNRL